MRKNQRILLHISNFRPVKRVCDVVRVFARVRADIDAILFMVGDGPEREAAARLAHELGVERDVCFPGKQINIEQYLGGADLFLMPSEHESFGLAALEALACETPVIATRAGGFPEVIVDGQTGALESVGDIEAMARRAIDLLRDDKARTRMGRQARQRAIERFAPDSIVAQYERLYEKTLTAPRQCPHPERCPVMIEQTCGD